VFFIKSSEDPACYVQVSSFIWKRLQSIWTIPDLRKKLLFTLGMLLVFRVLAHITVPLTHQEQVNLANLFASGKSKNLGQLLGLLDVFSGGSLQTFSFVALGVAPYITATIVMQLLRPILPALQNLSTQGEAGQQRFNQITRIITVVLATSDIRSRKRPPWAFTTLRFLLVRWYSDIKVAGKCFLCTRENRRVRAADHQGRHAHAPGKACQRPLQTRRSELVDEAH
jgi:SecY